MKTYLLLLLSLTSGSDKVKREWEALRGMWEWDLFPSCSANPAKHVFFSEKPGVFLQPFLPVHRNHNHCISTYSAS